MKTFSTVNVVAVLGSALIAACLVGYVLAQERPVARPWGKFKDYVRREQRRVGEQQQLIKSQSETALLELRKAGFGAVVSVESTKLQPLEKSR